MNSKMITVNQLEEMLAAGKLCEHHTAAARGYVSRKNPPAFAREYEGKFGRGYTLDRPR